MPEGSTTKAKILSNWRNLRAMTGGLQRSVHRSARSTGIINGMLVWKALFRCSTQGTGAEFSLHNLAARNWLRWLARIQRPLPDITKFHCETTYGPARGGKTAPKDTKPKGFSP
jgi:hypothetical protein